MKKLKSLITALGFALGLGSQACATRLQGNVGVSHSQTSSPQYPTEANETDYQLKFAGLTDITKDAKLEYMVETEINTIRAEGDPKTAHSLGFGARLKTGFLEFLGLVRYQGNTAEAVATGSSGEDFGLKAAVKVGEKVSGIAQGEAGTSRGYDLSAGVCYLPSEKWDIRALVNHEKNQYLARRFSAAQLRVAHKGDDYTVAGKGTVGQTMGFQLDIGYDFNENANLSGFIQLQQQKADGVERKEFAGGINFQLRTDILGGSSAPKKKKKEEKEEEKASKPIKIEECKTGLEYVNELRKKDNKEALEWDDRLYKLAVARSKDMTEREYFAHKNPDGKCVDSYMKEFDISEKGTLGENIFTSTGKIGSTKEVIDDWMDSPGHKAALLFPYSYKKAAIGCYESVCTFLSLAKGTLSCE